MSRIVQDSASTDCGLILSSAEFTNVEQHRLSIASVEVKIFNRDTFYSQSDGDEYRNHCESYAFLYDFDVVLGF